MSFVISFSFFLYIVFCLFISLPVSLSSLFFPVLPYPTPPHPLSSYRPVVTGAVRCIPPLLCLVIPGKRTVQDIVQGWGLRADVTGCVQQMVQGTQGAIIGGWLYIHHLCRGVTNSVDATCFFSKGFRANVSFQMDSEFPKSNDSLQWNDRFNTCN